MNLIKKIISNENNFSLYTLFFILFLYSTTIAFLLQVIILPNYFPHWVNDLGLLNQTDSILYHNLATELSSKINYFGWTHWELVSDRHFIVGLTALFYTLIYPEPWVMIPLNSFVHALSGVILARIALFFTKNRCVAFLAIMPYVFYPSALMWISQLLKDGYFNLGAILFCYGWMIFATENISTKKLKYLITPLIFILLGYILMALVRPYTLYVMRMESNIFIVLILLFSMYMFFQKSINFHKFFKKIIFCIACFFALKVTMVTLTEHNIAKYDQIEYSDLELNVTEEELDQLIISLESRIAELKTVCCDMIICKKDQLGVNQCLAESDVAQSIDNSKLLELQDSISLYKSQLIAHQKYRHHFKKYITAAEKQKTEDFEHNNNHEEMSTLKNFRGFKNSIYTDGFFWKSTNWIPEAFDTKLSALAGVRKQQIERHLKDGRGRSMIDTDITFNNAIDILMYTPRASQIAFLSPFPDIWFGEGSTKSTSVMRKISMFEMIYIYIALVFLPLALWRWKIKPELWVAFIYSYTMLLFLTMSFPNIGTLYRYRYAFLMITITIALTYFFNFIEKYYKNNIKE